MNILAWSTKQLCSLFDVDWESTQLCALIKELKIPSTSTIAGGAVVRTLLKLDIFKGDIDIFTHTHDGYKELVNRYEGDKTWQRSKHAYNFEFTFGLKKTKVQIIDMPVKGHLISQTFDTFDFEHCKLALMAGSKSSGSSKLKIPSGESCFLTTMAAPICLAKRELRLGLVRDPNYSLGRAIKYKRLGFDSDKVIEQLAAMAMKGMKDVQCCFGDDWSKPLHSHTEIDAIIAMASS